MSIRLAMVFAAVSMLCVPVGAEAQDEMARIHFQSGAAYYDAGAYEDALREFHRAYELSERAELYYNIALCYQQLGQLEEAARYLRLYLDEVADAPNRETLELRHRNLLRRIEARASSARTPEPTETTDPVEPTETTPDPEPSPEPVTETRPADPVPEPATEPEPTPEPGPESNDDGGGANVGAIAAISAGGAGLASFAILGAMAKAEESSVADLPCAETSSCSASDVSRMDGLALGADISLGIGVAAGVTGVVLFIVGSGGDDDEDPANVSFLPVVNPDRGIYGGTLSGRF